MFGRWHVANLVDNERRQRAILSAEHPSVRRHRSFEHPKPMPLAVNAEPSKPIRCTSLTVSYACGLLEPSCSRRHGIGHAPADVSASHTAQRTRGAGKLTRPTQAMPADRVALEACQSLPELWSPCL